MCPRKEDTRHQVAAIDGRTDGRHGEEDGCTNNSYLVALSPCENCHNTARVRRERSYNIGYSVKWEEAVKAVREGIGERDCDGRVFVLCRELRTSGERGEK